MIIFVCVFNFISAHQMEALNMLKVKQINQQN